MNLWKIGTIFLISILIFIVCLIALKSSNINLSQSFFGNSSESNPEERTKETQLNGEIFIVTRGRDNIKMGLVRVGIHKIHTPTNTIEKKFYTTTNADGKFTILVPQGDYKIYADAERYVFGETENYSWRVPVTLNQKDQTIFLSNNNQQPK